MPRNPGLWTCGALARLRKRLDLWSVLLVLILNESQQLLVQDCAVDHLIAGDERARQSI